MHRFIGNVNYDYALTGVHFVTEVCVLSNIKNKQLENKKKKGKYDSREDFLMKSSAHLSPLVLQFQLASSKPDLLVYLNFFYNLALHIRCHNQVSAIQFPAFMFYCSSIH